MNDEQRLEALKGHATEVFTASLPTFVQEFGIEVRLCRPGEEVPTVAADQRQTLKYEGYYTDSGVELRAGGELFISVATKNGRLLGFGIAERDDDPPNPWAISLVSVDEPMRRKRGIETEVFLGSERFTVGLVHLLIQTLLPVLERPVFTDATSPGSQYAFKSLGFVQREGTKNPCKLVLAEIQDAAGTR